MNDDYISRSAAIAAAAWGLSIGLLGVVWLCIGLIGPPDHVTVDAAALSTAIIGSVAAAVWQIKLYISRLCALIRVTAGLDSERGHGLQSVR